MSFNDNIKNVSQLLITLLIVLLVAGSAEAARTLVYEENFTGSCGNWTSGGNCVNNSFNGYFNLTTGTATSPNLNLNTLYGGVYDLEMDMWINSSQYLKIMPNTQSGSSDVPRYYLETGGSPLYVKVESSYSQLDSDFPYNVNSTWLFKVNKTAGTIKTSVNNTNTGASLVAEHTYSGLNPNQDYVRIDDGTISGYARIMNVRVYNYTTSGGETNNSNETGWVLKTHHDFESSNHSWTGAIERTGGYIAFHGTSNSGTLTSSDLNLTDYTTYRLEMTVRMNRTSGVKLHYNSGNTSLDGGKYLIGPQTSTWKWTHENEFWPEITGAPYDANVTIMLDVNKTASNSNSTVTWSGGGDDLAAFTMTYEDGDYVRFDVLNGTGYFRIYDFKVYNYTSTIMPPSAGNPPLNKSELNAESETWGAFLEELQDAWGSGVVHTKTISSTNYTTVPWYCSSTECSTTYLQGNSGGGILDCGSDSKCGIGGTYDATNRYCVVTDEFSQVCLSYAMRDDNAFDSELDGCFNTIDAIKTTNYGVMTDWRFGWDNNQVGTAKIRTGLVDDCASDSDARFIIMAGIAKDNTALSTGVRNDADAYLDEACRDFLNYTVIDTTATIDADKDRTVDYWLTGGCNIGTNGDLNWGNLYYPGYVGDAAMAMMVCKAHTGDDEYMNVARNFTEQYFGTINWDDTKSFRHADGKEYNYSTIVSGKRIPSCQVDCMSGGGNDRADRVRLVTLCAAGEFADRVMNDELHPELQEYCDDFVASAAWHSTNFSRSIKADGTINSGTLTDGYEDAGLAAFVDIYSAQTNLDERFNHIDTKFNDGTQKYSGACYGVYFPAFAQTSLGYAIGYADNAFQ